MTDAWIEDEHGARQGALTQGLPCSFRAAVRFEQALDDPEFAVALVNAQHQNVFVANSSSRGEQSGRFEAGEAVDFTVSFENALAPGRYAVSTLISHPGGRIADRWENIFSFVVTGAGSGRRHRRPASRHPDRGDRPRARRSAARMTVAHAAELAGR